MDVFEASMPGTLRTILILIALWWILRFLIKRNAIKRTVGHTHTTTAHPQDQRLKGEVRIENVPPHDRSTATTNGTISDADFEEIK